jgi:hypothetical protein
MVFGAKCLGFELDLARKFPHIFIMAPRTKVVLEKLIGAQLVKKFLPFIEPKGSLLWSQELATAS